MADDRFQQAKKVTLIGAFFNALLAVIKIIGGAYYHSHALVADGLHSFSDLLTDAMVFFASKYGSQDADISHPYGHRRFETAGTLLLSLFLIFAGFGIAWDSIYELIYKSWEAPGWKALPIAVFSIVINEWLFHYTCHTAKKIESSLLHAHAWHHRSDAASSLIVTIGLVASLAGYTYLDTIAAIIIAAMIIKMGVSYAWNSIKELVDTAVEPESLDNIRKVISGFKDVKKIHQLRTRLMGGDIFIDVHILVSPRISVSEGHYIAQQVHYALMKQFQKVRDVIVHVDPEDDEMFCPSMHLPTRTNIETQLLKPWKKSFPGISDWTLHYLEGSMQIDLLLDESMKDLKLLKKRIEEDLCNASFIQEVRIMQKVCRR